MGIPFFGIMGGCGGPNMMQQFQQFRANFQGDPKTEVQKLLQTGKMSQNQLNQLQAMAQQFQQFLH